MKHRDMTTCHCPADINNRHLEACPHFKPVNDPVNNPAHYTSHPSGVECIDIVEWLPHNRAAAIGYIWRCGQKDDPIQDLRKAIWFLEREIKRIPKIKAG